MERALLLSAGEFFGFGVGFFGELDFFEELEGVNFAVVAGGEGLDEFEEWLRFLEEGGGLELDADDGFDLVGVFLGRRCLLTRMLEPEVGRLSPSIISRVVVLPAPFGPSMPKVSPGLTEKEMSSTAVRVGYFLVEVLDLDAGGQRGGSGVGLGFVGWGNDSLGGVGVQ